MARRPGHGVLSHATPRRRWTERGTSISAFSHGRSRAGARSPDPAPARPALGQGLLTLPPPRAGARSPDLAPRPTAGLRYYSPERIAGPSARPMAAHANLLHRLSLHGGPMLAGAAAAWL